MLMDEANETNPEFTDERFLSASEKRLILNAWKTFLRHGCQLRHFTERLYEHLIFHCLFIAHYDLGGFYSYYFAKGSPRIQKFLDQFDPAKCGRSAEGGDLVWLSRSTGADLNRAMRESAAPYIDRLRFQFSGMEREKDLQLATQLAEKWGKRLMDSTEQIRLDSEPKIETPETPKQLGMSFGTEQ
jgi:hypothetical protein